MIHVENLRESYKITLLLLVASLGVFFDFVGVCMEQSGLNSVANNVNTGPNKLGADWYFLFFYVFWLVSMVLVTGSGSLRTYRFFLLALTAVALSYIPGDTHFALQNTNSSVSSVASGGGLKAAGLIILSFPVLLILGLLGSEGDSSLHRNTIIVPFMGGDDAEKNASAAPAYNSGGGYEMNMRPQSEFMNPVVAVDAEAAAANEARNSVKPESRINVQVDSVIAFKARTLYACKLLN